ncbi:MAG: TetR/AcrR family transcriptional regulator [Methanomassiliicoccus sp.]|nr:TetR/AcrR family transcriptional regulator [Methanomassiliicoccus sp.]
MGTAERRKRERERKEREIVEAARSLFFQKGFDATTVDEIAARLEVSKGTIYLYFTNKDEIYFAVAREGLMIVRDLFRDALEGPGTGLERLEAIGRAYIHFWSSQPDYRRLFHDTRLKVPPESSGPQGMEFARAGAEAFGMMVEAIRAGMEDGSIRPDTSPEKLAFCASSMVDGILERMERRGGRAIGPPRDEALEYAFDLMIRAVASPPERAPARKPDH